MPVLKDYNAFDGYYFQSGSIRNALDYQGVTAPHTGEPFTEALLFGVSGGMAFGYFYFHYDGYDPMVNILTRNTFNLFEPVLERLGIPYDVLQTTSAEKGQKNLIDTLEDGYAPIVFADMYGLPYNALDYDENNWSMMPIIVYGYEDEVVHISDRARVGLTVTPDQLERARARVKKDKHRIVVLGTPNEEKLASAVTMGIWDCIKLFTEKPPAGSANNFGFKGYERWIKLLTKPGSKGSWDKTLPRGRELFAGLTSAFHFSQQFGKDETYSAERHMMADFLQEASIILNKPELSDLCPIFRVAGDAWREMGTVLLPDSVPLLTEARQLMTEKHHRFLAEGDSSTHRRREINAREDALKDASSEFPLTEEETNQLLSQIADQVQHIRDLEWDAISALRAAMS